MWYDIGLILLSLPWNDSAWTHSCQLRLQSRLDHVVWLLRKRQVDLWGNWPLLIALKRKYSLFVFLRNIVVYKTNVSQYDTQCDPVLLAFVCVGCVSACVRVRLYVCLLKLFDLLRKEMPCSQKLQANLVSGICNHTLMFWVFSLRFRFFRFNLILALSICLPACLPSCLSIYLSASQAINIKYNVVWFKEGNYYSKVELVLKWTQIHLPEFCYKTAKSRRLVKPFGRRILIKFNDLIKFNELILFNQSISLNRYIYHPHLKAQYLPKPFWSSALGECCLPALQ